MTRSDQSASTYDDDFYTWTQDQAAAIRRAGARGGLAEDIDVEHLAEEVEDLGKRDLREVKSFIRLLLFHILKIAAQPTSTSVPHWKSEAREFQLSALRGFSPGMRQLIDVDKLWREAKTRISVDRRDLGLTTLDMGNCPLTRDDLLSETFDLDQAFKRLTEGRSE